MTPQKDLPPETEDLQGRVLSLALAGKTDRQIAGDLDLPLPIVAEHLSRLERVAASSGAHDLVARLSAAHGQGPRAVPPAPRTRVLLADDHHINHLTIQAMLEDRGVEIVGAFDGADALAKFKVSAFDRVLMDIDMPILDGVSAVRAIRDFERERGGRRTAIAMFTALSGREIEAAARDAGADIYLTKPITLNQLYDFVD